MSAFTRIAACDSVSATGKRIVLTKPLSASAADATVYLSEALNIHSDEVAKCTHIAIVVPNAENSAHEVITCAIADYSAANATMSNCTRGVIAYGATISSVTALIAAHEAGATVSVPVLVQNMVQLQEVVEGERATGANAFRIGDESDATIYLYFQNADGSKPGIRYNHTGNAFEFSDNGSSWTALGASGNHGTTANLKDHADVADAVSDSVAQGDIFYRNATEWTRLGAGTSGHVLKTSGAGADPAWADPNTLVTSEIDDTAYDATTWNGVTNKAPTKNAVRDKIESISNFSAGSILLVSSDTAASGTEGTYTKRKEIQIGYNGTITVEFTLSGGNGTYSAYGRIYVNGVAVGTERAYGTGSQTFSENIAVNAGDLVQIYAKNALAGNPSVISNFRIKVASFQGGVVTLA